MLGEKKHLCLTTGTSSGKSLAFALPILEAYRLDKNSKALVLFPTKALAQDQLGKLQKLFQQAATVPFRCSSLNINVYSLLRPLKSF